MTPTATLPAIPEKEILTPEIEQKIVTISDRAALVKVIDDVSLLVADEVETDIKALIKTIEDDYKDPIADAHALHKKLIKRRDDKTGPLEKLLEPIKTQRLNYQNEQKKKREAEEARLRKEAEEREEAERLERAAEIEREAAKLKAAGQVEEAEAVQQEAEQVMSTPTYVPPPRIAPPPKTKNAMKMIVDRERLQTVVDGLNRKTIKTPPVIPGVTFRQVWEFEVHTPTAVPEAWRKPS